MDGVAGQPGRALTTLSASDSIRNVTDSQITTISSPLNRPSLSGPAIHLVRRAFAVGILDDSHAVERLDLDLLKRIAREASALGIGQDAAIAFLGPEPQVNGLAGLIQRLDDSLTSSPLPNQEARELLRVFGREALAELVGTSAVSLGRYVGRVRDWPDDVGARIHWLALVVGDLKGAYNDFGVRRWFERRRPQLDGRSPRELLGSRWDPFSPEAERVRDLAAALVGLGAGG